MIYEETALTDDFIGKVMPLLHEHWEELAHFKDIKLDPDWDFYKRCVGAGIMKIYTAWTDDRALVGYACFAMQSNKHYKSSMQAACDVLFIDRRHRSIMLVAKVFIEFCDRKLKELGVEIVYHRYKLAQPALGRLIEKMGYEDIEVTSVRRL